VRYVEWRFLVGKFLVAIHKTNCKWRFGAINGKGGNSCGRRKMARGCLKLLENRTSAMTNAQPFLVYLVIRPTAKRKAIAKTIDLIHAFIPSSFAHRC
jgi:hypothetical protein